MNKILFLTGIVLLNFISVFAQPICHQDLLLIFLENNGSKTSIKYFSDDAGIKILDTVFNAANIKGMVNSEETINNELSLYIVSEDSLHLRQYSYLAPQPALLKSEAYHIPNVLGIADFWVLCKTADSITMISVEDMSGTITFPDRIPLQISDINFVKGNSIGSYYLHIAGKDNNGDLHCYRFSYGKTLLNHFVIDAFQGELIWAGGNHDKYVVLHKNNNDLLCTEYEYHGNTIYTTLLGSYDSIITATTWGYHGVVYVVKNNNQTIVEGFNFNNRTTIMNKTVPFDARKFYYLDHGPIAHVEYIDSVENKFIARVSDSIVIDTNNIYPIEASPLAHGVVTVCVYVGIDKDQFTENNIRLNPNPAQNNFKVTIDYALCEKNNYLELFDLSGKKLYATPFYSKCDLTIPIADLPSGVYIVKMKISDKIYMRKMMKH